MVPQAGLSELLFAFGGQTSQFCELESVMSDVWKFFFVVHDNFVDDGMPILGGMSPSSIAAVVMLVQLLPSC